jgi:hypothetical protein
MTLTLQQSVLTLCCRGGRKQRQPDAVSVLMLAYMPTGGPPPAPPPEDGQAEGEEDEDEVEVQVVDPPPHEEKER